MAQTVVEGTWEEVARQANRFSGKRVRLTVLDDISPSTNDNSQPFFHRATPEEFRQAFDALGAQAGPLPVLPPEAFERESLYADNEESR